MSELKNKKSLVIYFSRADENYAVGYVTKGNTEYIAEYVRDIVDADLFKAEPLIPYSKEYSKCIEEAKQRIGNAPIKNKLNDICKYEVIYIMTPVYWGSYAPEIETAVKNLDFTGKTVRIVTTHEGSGLANVVKDIKKLCVGANVLNDSIAIKGTECARAKSKIEMWI